MPNIIAFAMLGLWPVITAILWVKLPPTRALLVSMIGGYLLLPPYPAVIDLPLLPPLGKDTLPAICCTVMALALYGREVQFFPKSPLARGLMVVFLLSPVATVLTNGEPLVWGPRYLPALNLREAVSSVLAQAVILLPMLLGRHFLARIEDQRELWITLMIGALAYSLPILIELRLSPQMNIWVYGFFQHLFEQMMRGNGYRPIVFLYHALWVSFFVMTALVGVAALARQEIGARKLHYLLILAYLAAILVLSKSYAAMFYAAACLPVVLLWRSPMILRVAAILAVIALVYPLAKVNQWVPEDQIVALAGRMGEDRAHTLQFRFDNENVLVARAVEKPLFGWGLWGRNHVYDTTDGKFLTITDGRWVILLGVLGLVGFLAEFGLLALPVFMLWWRSRAGAGHPALANANAYAAPLALLLGVNMFDLIPNATITQLTWLMAGALIGHVEHAHASDTAPAASTPAAPRVMLIRTAI